MIRTALAFLLAAVIASADAWDQEKPGFVEKYRSFDPVERETAVRALKATTTDGAVDHLVGIFLTEPHSDVRKAIEDVLAAGIAGMGRARFYVHCREATRSPEDRARLIALLGRGGLRDTLETLRLLLRDREPLVRAASLDAARAAGFHSIEPDARRCLADPVPDVRVRACRILASIGMIDSAAALVASAEKDKDPGVKAEAILALKAISGQDFGDDLKAWKAWHDGQDGLRVTQAEVDRALDKGGEWLVAQRPQGYKGADKFVELELYAMLHAGVAKDHANVKSAVDAIYANPMAETYRVSLGALALRDLDRHAHQGWLAQAAQFLVDNQCENGQWSYGEPVPGDTVTPDIAPTLTGGGTRATKRIAIRRVPKRRGPKVGDNSNTQFAVLGLRACSDAGIDVPRDVWLETLSFLKDWQSKDGSFRYSEKFPDAYGSITCSALGAYLISSYYAGFGMRRDDKVARPAIKWIAENFTVTENPKRVNNREFLYYWLYGLERIGVLADTEFFGRNEWYQAGARYLIGEQAPDGSWNNANNHDTCFAILFLRRATHPVGKVEDK